MKKRFKEKALESYAAHEWEIRIPELALNPNKTNFYDFTVDDFMMVDYQPIKPQLKLELGI